MAVTLVLGEKDTLLMWAVGAVQLGEGFTDIEVMNLMTALPADVSFPVLWSDWAKENIPRVRLTDHGGAGFIADGAYTNPPLVGTGTPLQAFVIKTDRVTVAKFLAAMRARYDFGAGDDVRLFEYCGDFVDPGFVNVISSPVGKPAEVSAYASRFWGVKVSF